MTHRRNVPAFKYKKTKQYPARSHHSTQQQGMDLKQVITEDPLTKMQIKTTEKMPDELRPVDTLAYTYPPYILVGVITAAFLLLFLLFF